MLLAVALGMTSREALAEESKGPAAPAPAAPSAPAKPTPPVPSWLTAPAKPAPAEASAPAKASVALLGVPLKAPAAADASPKPMRVASLTPVAAPSRPAPPKESPVVAPRPVAASTERSAAQSSCAGVAELRTELRTALAGEPNQLTPEQREEREHLQAELDKETATQQALLTAVEKGVPRGPLSEAIDKSGRRVTELHERIGAIKPALGSSGLAAMPARLDALAVSFQALELRLSQLGSSPEEASAPAEADRPAEAEKAPKADEPKAVGLNIDAQVASLYAFRGLNVFKSSSQMDQHALFAPGITYSPTFLEGLTVGYWGAYQISGDNASQLVKSGFGNEQDLTVSYGRDVIKEKLNVRGGVTNYLYPFAERAVAKANTPYYLEPWAQLTYSGPVTASVLATYFYGTQNAIRPFSYVYVHPGVEKTFTVNKTIGFVPGAGLGYKVFTHDAAIVDNRYEVTADMKLPIAASTYSYATPALHYAWSNFSNGAVASAHAVWLSVNVGMNL
jgi:hypothetical protein